MKTIVIPMKGQNERLPGKNLAMLGGQPLCYYLLSAAHYSETDEVVVDTADPEITARVNRLIEDYEWDKVKISPRPAEYQDPMLGGNKLLERFILEGNPDDIFMQAHVTSPFLTIQTINAAFEAVETTKNSIFSVTDIPKQRLWMIGEKESNLVPLNHDPNGALLRTQDLPKVFSENGAFFCFTRLFYLANNRRRNTATSLVYILDYPETIDIDTSEDLEEARAYLQFTFAPIHTNLSARPAL